MEVKMNGRTALITGGSTGLGRAMALGFAGCGAAVALVARREEPLQEARQAVAAMGAKVAAYSCDITDAGRVAAMFDQVLAEFGQVDVLVNNAGISRAMPFAETSDEIWQADFDLKLFAAVRLCRLAFPGMVERRWGRIINVLNIGAKAPAAASAPTSVARAAGMAFTKVLAGEGAPHNVLVNALCTGFIDSDQWVRRHAQENAGRSYRDFLAEMGKRIPMGRVGEAEEFANMACFLASDAGSYITGTAINVDGGRSPVV